MTRDPLTTNGTPGRSSTTGTSEPGVSAQESDSSGSTPTPIAIAVVEHRECFLVGVRSSEVALGGKHEFPGGKLKPHEAPELAAIRECQEETGLHVEVTGTYSVHVENYDYGAIALHFFAARLMSPGAATNIAPPWKWVARSDLATLDFPSGNCELIKQLTAAEPPAGLS